MKLFYLPSSEELAHKIDIPKADFTWKQFSDGEWHVKVDEKVRKKDVWVLAQTGPPADTIIQLLLLCNALYNMYAKVHILLTYYGYARQDRKFPGEPVGADIMYSILQNCWPYTVTILHIHNYQILEQHERLTFLSRKNIVPYDFFAECAHDADLVVAPDKGAQNLAWHLFEYHNKEKLFLEKSRPEPEKVITTSSDSVEGKNVLIVDDMISTGRTILKAAELLHEKGARSIKVAATHGIFSDNAVKDIEKSVIEKVTVTNSLTQKRDSKKIEVKNIAPFLKDIITGDYYEEE